MYNYLEAFSCFLRGNYLHGGGPGGRLVMVPRRLRWYLWWYWRDGLLLDDGGWLDAGDRCGFVELNLALLFLSSDLIGSPSRTVGKKSLGKCNCSQQWREQVYWRSFCLIGKMFRNDIKDSCEMISDSTLYRWFNSTQFLKVFSSCKRWWPGDLLCCWLMLDQRIRNSNTGTSLLIIP